MDRVVMPHIRRHVVSSLDVQVLQTAASLENLAVVSYGSAARLSAVQHGNPTLRTFIERTRAQHAAHAAAFNAAVVKAGGKAQHEPDQRYAGAVRRALDGLTGVASVVSAVSLLESLEDTKAQSYTRYASLAGQKLRPLLVSVAAVEAQHRTFLLAALQLLNVGAADLIDVPSAADRLPAALGSQCCRWAFYPTAAASAVNEGAVGGGAVRRGAVRRGVGK